MLIMCVLRTCVSRIVRSLIVFVVVEMIMALFGVGSLTACRLV